MGTLGRIAAGTSDSTILRAADVFLKERRKLILVPRETPWNLIHARNVCTLLEAGALIMPASPGFYSRPTTIAEVADTVADRILDQLGIPAPESMEGRPMLDDAGHGSWCDLQAETPTSAEPFGSDVFAFHRGRRRGENRPRA